MAKPAVIPEWASSDQVDSTSGQNNVVEPLTSFKTYGWLRKSRPARQYLNWLGRWTYEWIQWISDEYDLFTQDIADNAAAIAVETAARTSADTILQGNIDSEASTRASADTVLQGNIDTVASDLSDEATTRGNADSALDARLDDYDADTLEQSGIMELTGFAANQDINYYAQYKRSRASNGSYRQFRELVLWVPTVSATSNSNSMTILAYTIPAGFYPATEQNIPITLINAGTSECGWIQVTTSGDWVLRRYDNSSFGVGSTKGILSQTIRIHIELITP